MIKYKDWGKLLTAMITPFKKDGSLNYKEIERVSDYLITDQKNDGIVVCGSTGEAPTLSFSEKLEVLEIVQKTVGHQAAVLFGAGTNNTQESIELTKAAERLGVAGIMLVCPAYNRPGQDGLFAHFSKVALETSLPIIVYNNPGRTSINLQNETLYKMINQSPNIVAIKNSILDLSENSEILINVPDDFRVYTGDDVATLPTLSVGGYGVVSIAGHICGNLIRDQIDCYYSHLKKAMEIHQKLFCVYKALFITSNPVPVKYMLSLKGFDCETVRLPLVQLNDQQKKLIRDSLIKAQIPFDQFVTG